jgi:hypothetical protein
VWGSSITTSLFPVNSYLKWLYLLYIWYQSETLDWGEAICSL